MPQKKETDQKIGTSYRTKQLTRKKLLHLRCTELCNFSPRFKESLEEESIASLACFGNAKLGLLVRVLRRI